MPNMSYCRFENTLHDLKGCFAHMEDEALNAAETKARSKLLKLCRLIAEDYPDEEYDEDPGSQPDDMDVDYGEEDEP